MENKAELFYRLCEEAKFYLIYVVMRFRDNMSLINIKIFSDKDNLNHEITKILITSDFKRTWDSEFFTKYMQVTNKEYRDLYLHKDFNISECTINEPCVMCGNDYEFHTEDFLCLFAPKEEYMSQVVNGYIIFPHNTHEGHAHQQLSRLIRAY